MRELKIDLDGKKRIEGFLFRLSLLKEILEKWKYKIVKVKVRETRKGYHIYLKLNKDITFEFGLLFRLLLGDDRNRAMFDLYNYEIGKKWKTDILFSKKKVLNQKGDLIYETGEEITVDSVMIEKMIEVVINGKSENRRC